MMSISRIAPNDVHSKKCTNRYSITKAGKRIRDASRYTIKEISLKLLFLSDIFLFPFIRQQITVLA